MEIFLSFSVGKCSGRNCEEGVLIEPIFARFSVSTYTIILHDMHICIKLSSPKLRDLLRFRNFANVLRTKVIFIRHPP